MTFGYIIRFRCQNSVWSQTKYRSIAHAIIDERQNMHRRGIFPPDNLVERELYQSKLSLAPYWAYLRARSEKRGVFYCSTNSGLRSSNTNNGNNDVTQHGHHLQVHLYQYSFQSSSFALIIDCCSPLSLTPHTFRTLVQRG